MSYFTVEEDLKQLHIQIPKALLYEKKYTSEKRLSNDAKLLYGFFLDRVSLSLKNGWFDEHNRLYIQCDQITMSKVLGCSEKKARNIRNELIEFELLEEVKVGQGKSNRLYPKKVFVTTVDLKNYIDLFLEEVSAERKKERNRIAKYRPDNVKDVENTMNGKNDRTNTVETTVLEQSDSVYSNNDFSNNDFKVVVVDKSQSIIDLFKSFRLEKRIMPHTINLLKQYSEVFDIEVFEQIFIDASSENVQNKYRYIKEVFEKLKNKNIFTIEKYNKDREEFKSSKRNSRNNNKSKPKSKSEEYNDRCNSYIEHEGKLVNTKELGEELNKIVEKRHSLADNFSKSIKECMESKIYYDSLAPITKKSITNYIKSNYKEIPEWIK